MATIRRPPVLQFSMLVCAVLAVGCPSRDRNTAVSGATSVNTATATTSATATAGDVGSPGQQVAVHDPAHPPIDRPLRKQGLDPAHLRPFEDAAKYIAFLERPDRAAWQKPDAVVAALGLTGKETVIDIGAGSGYFSFRLARAVPEGKVIALDVDPEMIRHIHHKAMTEGVRNVQVAFAKPDHPGVPAEADLVFMCDVLHHIQDRPAWLAKLAAQMHKGARLALVEFKEGKLPEGPPEAVKLSRAQLVALATGAGLVLDSEKTDLLPYQTFSEYGSLSIVIGKLSCVHPYDQPHTKQVRHSHQSTLVPAAAYAFGVTGPGPTANAQDLAFESRQRQRTLTPATLG